jgi:site-specific recombinase XerD
VLIRRRISSKNALVNKHLKTLAEMIETDIALSFHVSRHSFADYARASGVDLYAISKALGHSNLKVTETYLKSFDHDAVDAAMDGLFNA